MNFNHHFSASDAFQQPGPSHQYDNGHPAPQPAQHPNPQYQPYANGYQYGQKAQDPMAANFAGVSQAPMFPGNHDLVAANNYVQPPHYPGFQHPAYHSQMGYPNMWMANPYNPYTNGFWHGQQFSFAQTIPPQMPNPNPVVQPPRPEVTLTTDAIWRQFRRQVAEMFVSNLGRGIFPGLKYKISKLDAKKMYTFGLKLKVLDGQKFHYCRDEKKWSRTEKRVEGPWVTNEIFKETPRTGQDWMENGVDYSKQKIFNQKSEFRSVGAAMTTEIVEERKTTMLLVETQTKYIPVLTAYEVCGPSKTAVGTYELPETIFIVVTRYSNETVKNLKTLNNDRVRGDIKLKAKQRMSTTSSIDTSASTSSGSLTPPGPCGYPMGP